MDRHWTDAQCHWAWVQAGRPVEGFQFYVSQRLWDCAFNSAHDALDNTASWRAVEGFVTR